MADLKTLMINLMEEQAAVLMKHLQRLKGDGSETVPLPPVEKIEELLKKGKKKKEPVDPNKPKKPSSAYILYMSENQAPFKAANPSSTQTEVMTTLGNRWTTLPVEAKAKYVKQAEIRKELYEMKMAVYTARDPNSSSGSIPIRKSPIKVSVTASGVADAPTILAPPVPPTPIVSVSEIVAPASAESEKEMRKRKRRALREAEALAAAASVAQPVAVPLPPIVQETFVPESEKKKVHHGVIHNHNSDFYPLFFLFPFQSKLNLTDPTCKQFFCAEKTQEIKEFRC